jgi:hypothetical protein
MIFEYEENRFQWAIRRVLYYAFVLFYTSYFSLCMALHVFLISFISISISIALFPGVSSAVVIHKLLIYTLAYIWSAV